MVCLSSCRLFNLNMGIKWTWRKGIWVEPEDDRCSAHVYLLHKGPLQVK